MSYNLTGKMKQLYDFIVAYNDEVGYSPSMEEMKTALDLRSKSGIHRMIVALEERGKIQRLPYRARSIVPVGEDDNLFLRLPAELLWKLNIHATTSGVSKIEIITRAIVRELAEPRAA